MKRTLLRSLIFVLLIGLCITGASCKKEEKTPQDSQPTEGTTENNAAETTTSGNTTPEQEPVLADKSHASDVDLVLFMGQSNMAGRGTASEATAVKQGHAYEFKAVSDPTKLYGMTGDFGISENREGGVDDGTKKSGSMVPAFCEAYYEESLTPIVAVSCSQGGTRISQWQSTGALLQDAMARLETAKRFLNASEEYKIRHIYMVWCQGESDGDANTDATLYKTMTNAMVSAMMKQGVEKCFLIAIGNDANNPGKYDTIRNAQLALCQENNSFLLVSDSFVNRIDQMKDQYHYIQAAYNEVGAEAGTAAGAYAASVSEVKVLGEASFDFAEYNAENRDTASWKKDSES